MKKTIRIIGLLLVMVLAFTLVACGKDMSNSAYLGKWTGTSAEMSGISMSVESVIGGEFSFELLDNGKCTLVIADETETGSWDETDSGFSVENEFEFVVDGDKATMDYSGVTITFERQ